MMRSNACRDYCKNCSINFILAKFKLYTKSFFTVGITSTERVNIILEPGRSVTFVLYSGYSLSKFTGISKETIPRTIQKSRFALSSDGDVLAYSFTVKWTNHEVN